MEHKIFTFLQDHFPRLVAIFFTTMTFIDAIDLFWRCVSGLITVAMFYFGIRNYYRRKELMRIDKQIKEQQLFDIIQSNKNKYGSN